MCSIVREINGGAARCQMSAAFRCGQLPVPYEGKRLKQNGQEIFSLVIIGRWNFTRIRAELDGCRSAIASHREGRFNKIH
jgi:hypothetical protein